MRNLGRTWACLFFFVASWGILAGCAGAVERDSSVSVAAVCRHSAFFAATTWADLTGEEVRVQWGPGAADECHAQAQALHEGIWRWLSVSCGVVELGEADGGWMAGFDPGERSAYSAMEFYERFLAP